VRPADTSPEAWEKFVEVQRALSPEERLARVFELSELVNSFAEAGMRERHPAASARQVFLRLARLRLGEELFARAYGVGVRDS